MPGQEPARIVLVGGNHSALLSVTNYRLGLELSSTPELASEGVGAMRDCRRVPLLAGNACVVIGKILWHGCLAIRVKRNLD